MRSVKIKNYTTLKIMIPNVSSFCHFIMKKFNDLITFSIIVFFLILNFNNSQWIIGCNLRMFGHHAQHINSKCSNNNF